MTFRPEFLRTLRVFRKWVGERVPEGYVLYLGEHEQAVDGFQLVNAFHLPRIFS